MVPMLRVRNYDAMRGLNHGTIQGGRVGQEPETDRGEIDTMPGALGRSWSQLSMGMRPWEDSRRDGSHPGKIQIALPGKFFAMWDIRKSFGAHNEWGIIGNALPIRL